MGVPSANRHKYTPKIKPNKCGMVHREMAVGDGAREHKGGKEIKIKIKIAG